MLLYATTAVLIPGNVSSLSLLPGKAAPPASAYPDPTTPPAYSQSQKSSHAYLFLGESWESLGSVKEAKTAAGKFVQPQLKALTSKQKTVLGVVCKNLITTWNNDPVWQNDTLVLSNARFFWGERLLPALQNFPAKGNNKGIVGNLIKSAVNERGDAIKGQYLTYFMTHVQKHVEARAKFDDQVDQQMRVMDTLKATRPLGRWACQRAIWLYESIPDEQAEALRDCVLVEDFTGKEQAWALYFWKKDGPDDKPSEDKIFGAVIYNATQYRKAVEDEHKLTKRAITYAIKCVPNLGFM
ncbi:hypothetical protein BOTBODRAFT_174323 [Botryobasidium botryosum FD-172 SS1]|uniref:Uncharacterized protein n=1 Tax=Botryobasidium botryosum (strain FD-172 SS1) TaxID=930990 RepID=A0A067MUA3_BOTB1|nr:hypothetical protein BOTBODRAFT_174323 [Botryobasidium botryosum FD-172 SS1]